MLSRESRIQVGRSLRGVPDWFVAFGVACLVVVLTVNGVYFVLVRGWLSTAIPRVAPVPADEPMVFLPSERIGRSWRRRPKGSELALFPDVLVITNPWRAHARTALFRADIGALDVTPLVRGSLLHLYDPMGARLGIIYLAHSKATVQTKLASAGWPSLLG